MKKIILTKAELVAKPDDGGCTTLLDRKSMLQNYKELFKALFELPDKKVVARVLDAINNKDKNLPGFEVVEVCRRCNQNTPKITLVDAATQTDENFKMHQTSVSNTDDSNDATTSTKTIKALNAVQETQVDSTLKTEDLKSGPIKRRRRRKVQLPQVIKKSQAQEQQQRNKPILQKRKATPLKTVKNNDDKKRSTVILNGKRQRLDSTSSATSAMTAISDFFEEDDLRDSLRPEDIKNMMVHEWLTAESIDADGLLPIQSAIVNNDEKQLSRQILVWKNLKNEDLNTLLTEDDEDCLQLAVSEKSSPDIVQILLSKGLNVECRDANSNTIIHLAILNEATVEVMQLLMEKIDLESLLVLNDDGYTPLHLAVRQDEFMLAEALLDALDKRLLGKPYYERDKKQISKADFLHFYENRCKLPELKAYLHSYSSKKFSQKRKLMDGRDVRSGNTVLLYSIENKLEHLIYFLLAHLADPKAESFNGQSATTYMNEFAKCLNLSLRIDQIMGNICSILFKYSN